MQPTSGSTEIAQQRKGIALMQDEAARCGRRLPLTKVHAALLDAALLDAAIAAGDGDMDNAAVIKQIRRMYIGDSA